MPSDHPSVIDLPNFIQATRDSGYRSTASAIAELVDNSLEAGATRVFISVRPDPRPDRDTPIVDVTDNGAGMSRKTLRESLRFGGSSRFGARHGLGRFGMGLPNASLSQSRRVEVVSWTSPKSCWFTYLDVNEIVAGRMEVVPMPQQMQLPPALAKLESDTGTVVRWSDCDRLENRRSSTIERKLISTLGRVFRHFIWQGVRIFVNGQVVAGIDPLYVHRKSPLVGAEAFGNPLEFRVRTTPTSNEYGVVKVTFSELPVEQWASLTTIEKRERGISNGAGVSIVRGGREIDYGWFFMGGKRRENYDDWWRCEVQFEPVLDDAFGITHTKQEIRPAEHLLEALSAELEEIAKALNARARTRYAKLKSAAQVAPVESQLQRGDAQLPTLPKRSAVGADLALLRRVVPKTTSTGGDASTPSVQYRLIEEDQPDAAFFRTVTDGDRVVVVINTKHAFYKAIYGKLTEGSVLSNEDCLRFLQALLLSAGRAEAMAKRQSDVDAIEGFRKHWGQVLSLLLGQ